MRVHVLFDEDGQILAMMQLPDKLLAGQPEFGFIAEAGERVATLKVPLGFEVLNARELHLTMRVDLSQAEPRLVESQRRIFAVGAS
jgi:hypothetical protein